jgi:uncharacterized integral membrane protein
MSDAEGLKPEGKLKPACVGAAGAVGVTAACVVVTVCEGVVVVLLLLVVAPLCDVGCVTVNVVVWLLLELPLVVVVPLLVVPEDNCWLVPLLDCVVVPPLFATLDTPGSDGPFTFTAKPEFELDAP